MDTSKFLGTFEKFGSVIGGQAGAVMKQAASWGQFAAGCAAGIAGSGPWGVVGCGLGFIEKIFGLFGGAPTQAPAHVPRTYFAPRGSAMPFIVQDTIRLAQVLKHYYGVSAYFSLWQKVEHVPRFAWIRDYPPMPDNTGDRLVPPSRPTPGHNLRTLLQMFCGPQNPLQADIAINNALVYLAAVRGRSRMEGPGGGRPLWMRYVVDNDLSIETIAHGAYIGRSAIAKGKVANITCNVSTMQSAREHIAGYFGGNIAVLQGDAPAVLQCDFTPFVILDELINFFAAITSRELVATQARREFLNQYGISQQLPVSQLYVHDIGAAARSGKPPEDGGISPPYDPDPKCRTNLKRYPSDCERLGSELYHNPTNENVARETAAIRLCAAFSYLHMQYQWSGMIKELRSDPIGAIAPIDKSDPTWEMRLPVDPRQILSTGYVIPVGLQRAMVYNLRDGEEPVNPALFELNKRITTDPTQTFTTAVRPAPSRASGDGFTRAKTTPRTLVAAIDERERIVQQAIAKARAAAPTLEMKPLDMRPMTLPGFRTAYSQRLLATARMKPELERAPATTPLLVGAAALLALKLLK
jgi:hypothetical protein